MSVFEILLMQAASHCIVTRMVDDTNVWLNPPGEEILQVTPPDQENDAAEGTKSKKSRRKCRQIMACVQR